MTGQSKTTVVHPFYEGAAARHEGRSKYDNPHPSESWKRSAWQHGWDHEEEIQSRGGDQEVMNDAAGY